MLELWQCAAAAALKLRKGDGLARGCDDAKSCGIITKQSFRYELYTSSLKLNIGTSKWWIPECITSLMCMIDFITQYLRKKKIIIGRKPRGILTVGQYCLRSGRLLTTVTSCLEKC